MYAMNFEFQFWLDMSTIGIYQENHKNYYMFNSGVNRCVQNMSDAYDMLSTQ